MWKAFFAGAVGYPLLELCWRGRTHPTMAAAGGLGALWLRFLRHRGVRLPLGALLGGAGITVIEGAFGLLFNRDYRIWDYRALPLNWRGQVCAPFAAAWCLLSGAALGAMRCAQGSAPSVAARAQRRHPRQLK